MKLPKGSSPCHRPWSSVMPVKSGAKASRGPFLSNLNPRSDTPPSAPPFASTVFNEMATLDGADFFGLACACKSSDCDKMPTNHASAITKSFMSASLRRELTPVYEHAFYHKL